MRTFFARIGHALLLLMMMSGLALPLQVQAQYEMDSFEQDEQALMNGDADIPVIVIPDEEDDDGLPPGGGCRGGPCGRSSSAASSSTAATSSAASSASSRAPRPVVPLRPAAPATPSVAKPIIVRTPNQLVLFKEKIRKAAAALKENAAERKEERLNPFDRKENGMIVRGFEPAVGYWAAGWDWNDYRLPLLFGNGATAVPLIGYWRTARMRRKKNGHKKSRRKDDITLCCQLLFGKRKIHIYLADILGVVLVGSLVIATLMMLSPTASAEATTPARRVFSSRLTNSSGTPITSEQKLRFSYWRGGNSVPADLTATGAINTNAANYAGWKEEHTVKPNVTGNFTVELGKFSGGLPVHQMTVDELRNLFLQVEVKPSGSPDSSYFLVDPFPLDDTRDRTFVSTNIFALNADMLDQRDVGTGSGAIPFLLSGGVLPVSTMAGGTRTDFFTVDNDNTSTTTSGLKFGGSLNKTLLYSKTNNRFEFNDNVHVQGNLTVSGTINGVDITSLTGSDSALKASSGGGLNLNVTGGNYRINGAQTDYAGGTATLANNATSYVFLGSGGLKAQTTSFPTDESYIPVAQVTTAGGVITAIDDKRVVSSDDRETTVKKVIQPGFSAATYQADASDNVGTLESTFDGINNRNFYKWTSTRPTLQDYDVVLEVPLSAKFIRWKSGAIKIYYRTTSSSTTNNKLDISVFDTNGTPVGLTGGNTNLASTAWTSTTLNFSGSPTWTAGQSMVIRIKVSAKDSFQAHIGAVELNYDDLLSP